MNNKVSHCLAGLLMVLSIHHAQASSQWQGVPQNEVLDPGSSFYPSEQQAEDSYLSSNQNKRLSASQGQSLDTVIPLLSIGESGHLEAFTRINNEEQHYALGLNMGRSHYSFMMGNGEGFSRLANQFSKSDPYYFHGGTTARYRFSNMEWAYQFNSNLNITLGRLAIDAERLEDRYTHYIGGSIGPVNMQYMQVERGDVHAGTALSLGYDSPMGRFDWSALRHREGGEIQQFAFTFKSSSSNQYGLAIGSQHNPLIEEDSQYRVMFRFSRALGTYRMGADEASEEEKPKSRKPLFLGGAAVVAALALSSGSSGQDTNTRLTSQHAAVRQRLNQINPVSVQENLEYGGWVYQTPDDRYTTTAPVRGDATSVYVPYSLIPPGGTALAFYHTHAAYDPRYLNEQFSPTDIASHNTANVDGYLGTPFGRFLWHDHNNNNVVNLGSIAN